MEGGASRTALGAAMHRAVHQLIDRPQVFADPLAFLILGPDAEAKVRGATDGLRSRLTAGLRLFVAIRSRFAEDTLAEAFAAGTRQYVLLGAGLDTFAYRSAEKFPGLRVFEVDHPATQAWKCERLARAKIDLPSALSFAPIDFERELLPDALARAGFDANAPAVFAWLGVVPYLTRESIFSTLHAITTFAHGTIVMFDYGEPANLRNPRQLAAHAMLSVRVAAAGEPFRSFFRASELASEILSLGYSRAEDFDAAALNARYLAGMNEANRLLGGGHIMRAIV